MRSGLIRECNVLGLNMRRAFAIIVMEWWLRCIFLNGRVQSTQPENVVRRSSRLGEARGVGKNCAAASPEKMTPMKTIKNCVVLYSP